VNAVTKTQAAGQAPAQPQRSRAEAFLATALPKARQDAIEKILPAHVKKERFLRNFAIAVNQHPKLLNCDPIEVFNEVSKAAALGLYMDPQLGEAYLITGFSDNRTVPQLRLGYRGLIKLARQSGEIKTIYAHEVHAADECEIRLGDEKRLDHRPNMMVEDRGPIVLYYAVVKYVNGETDFEPMTIAQIHRIRDRSDGWKAFKAGKIKSTPWGTDEGEMAKKTVLRRLLKRIPASPELADAIAIEDKADFSGIEEVPAAPVRAAATLEAAGEAAAQIEIIEDEPDAEPEPAKEPEAKAQPKQAKAATKEPEPEVVEVQVEQVLETERDPDTDDMFDDFPGDRPTSQRRA